LNRCRWFGNSLPSIAVKPGASHRINPPSTTSSSRKKRRSIGWIRKAAISFQQKTYNQRSVGADPCVRPFLCRVRVQAGGWRGLIVSSGGRGGPPRREKNEQREGRWPSLCSGARFAPYMAGSARPTFLKPET
jgi:hypothetical protein